MTRSMEVRQMIRTLGMSQRHFAQLVGTSDRTIKRQLSGECSILFYYASKYVFLREMGRIPPQFQ